MYINLEIINKPYREYKIHSFILFSDKSKIETDCIIKIYRNGKITGEFEITTFKQSLEDNDTFKLTGVYNSFNVLSNSNFIIGRYVNGNFEDNSYKCKIVFVAFDVILYSTDLKKNIDKKLQINYELLNLYRTFLLNPIPSSIGDIYINHYKDHEEIEQIMRFYEIPLITSIATIEINPISKSIEHILNEIKLTILDLLKITSLSQTVWHEYVSTMIYEQIDESNRRKCIFINYKSPKGKIPIEYQLTNEVHSSTFITNAWKGYSKQLEKYGFDLALEWYIESNTSNLDVIKFINATTCLELLVSKFKNLNLVKYPENEEEINGILKKVRKHTRKYLINLNIEQNLIDRILQKLSNRKTYVENIDDLINYWGIDISDIKTSISQIVNIRDQIIHRGLYYHDIKREQSFKVLDAAQDLFTILTRLFLAMLNYKEDYYHPYTGQWIKFDNIRKKYPIEIFRKLK